MSRQFRIHLPAGVQFLFFSLLPDDPDSAEKDDNVGNNQKSKRLRQQSRTGFLDVNQLIGQNIQPQKLAGKKQRADRIVFSFHRAPVFFSKAQRGFEKQQAHPIQQQIGKNVHVEGTFIRVAAELHADQRDQHRHHFRSDRKQLLGKQGEQRDVDKRQAQPDD